MRKREMNMKKMTLFQLTEEFKQLMGMAYDADVDEQCFIDTMEGLQGEIGDKADGYATVMSKMDSDISYLDAEIKRLTEIKKHINNRKKNISDTLFKCMKEMDIQQIDTVLHRISIVKNGGVLPLDVFGNVPERFTKVTIEPDNSKIRAALDAGENLDFAKYKEHGERLSIK